MFIKDFPNYDVFEDGRVFSHKSQIYLKPQNNGNGYLKVHLYKNGKMYQRYVHLLVAATFIPNPSKMKYVDHVDRNKSNNDITNLRWCSAQENTANTAGKPRYSVSRKGATHYEESIKSLVRNDFNTGLTVSELSLKYNVPRQTISGWIRGCKDLLKNILNLHY